MKRSKWAALVVALCLVVTVAAVAYAAGKAKPTVPVAEVVRAKRFELVDSAGEVRALLGPTQYADGGPALALYDNDGKECASLAVLVGISPQLSLGEAAKSTRVILGPVDSSYGWPALVLCGQDGKVQATFEVVSDGAPALRLMDKAGKMRASLRVTDTETPETAESSLVLLDREGKVLWQAP